MTNQSKPEHLAADDRQAQVESLQAQIKQLQLAAAASEQRYAMIIDRAVDYGIITLDTEGSITEWNEGAVRILGWDADQARGQPIASIFTEPDQLAGIPLKEMAYALEQGRATDERWHARSDGSLFWANSEMMPLKDTAGTLHGYLKVLRDRTQQHLDHQKQQADAEFLESVLSASGDCIKVLDLEGRLAFMSEGGKKAMEVSDFNGIRGCPWPDFWEGKGNVDAKNALAAARAGKTGRFLGEAPTFAGNPRWWDVQVTPINGPDGQPERILSVSRDISALKTAKKVLELSEHRYRSLYNALDHGFCIVEVKCDEASYPYDYRFLEINSAFERQTGLKDALGQWMRTLAPDHEQYFFHRYAEVARNGQPAKFEHAAKALGNRHYEVYAYRIGEPEHHHVAILFSDISARKREEQRRAALIELNEAFRLIDDPATLAYKASQILGRTLNADRAGYATVHADGTLFTVEHDWCLPSLPNATGTHRTDDFGSSISALSLGELIIIGDVSEDLRTKPKADNFLAFGSCALVHVPIIEAKRLAAFFFVNQSTPTQWSNADIAFIESVATNTRSAVQRYKAEQELNTLAVSLERQVHARTLDRNRLWQLSSDLMLVAGFDGTINAVNPAWTEVLGWGEGDLLGADLFELIHPEDLQHSEQGALAIAVQKQSLNRFENRYRTKSGDYRWISWTAGPSDDFIIAVGRDVSSEKEKVAALAKAEQALRQSQKMEAVGQLTGGLAHDFNNLLAGISGSLELLQRRLAQGRFTDVDRYVSTAQSAARRAAALTHRLLAFSRQQTLDPKPTDAAQLIMGMEELIRRAIGPQVELQLNLMPELWNALVDPSQLENSLLNLCINARDAMPDGGRIVIEASNTIIDSRMAVPFDLPAGEYMCLRVSDTGVGMPPKVIARIFDPFFTTKPTGKGTGLGLSMIYGFAKQSGGQVRVHSTVGVGTAMYIYLPRYVGAAQQAPEMGSLSHAELAKVGDTVLVVDDEPSIRMMVAEVLEELGYIALEAADGASALTILESSARIDLLITDVGLPGGINGRQVADRARLVRKDLKVLFITGYAEQAVIGEVQLEDGMQVLTKPFAMETMAERLKLLLAVP